MSKLIQFSFVSEGKKYTGFIEWNSRPIKPGQYLRVVSVHEVTEQLKGESHFSPEYAAAAEATHQVYMRDHPQSQRASVDAA